MKTFNLIITLTALIVIGAGCKKNSDDEIIPAGTQNPGTPTGNFIEFKMDGVHYRMDETAPNSTHYIGTTNPFGFQNGTYHLTAQFGHIVNGHSTASMPSTGITLYSSSALDTGYYECQSDSDNIMPIDPSGEFVYMFADQSSFQANAYITTSIKLHITEADSSNLGYTAGTFEISYLEKLDENGDVTSVNHHLTEGKFRVQTHK